jgi:hypothetical protein
MSVRASTKLLLLGALILGAAGCASTPGGSPGSHGSQGGAGGTGQGAPAGAGSQQTAPGPPAAGATAGAGGNTAGQAGAAAGNGPGQTSEERRAAIDQHLSDSLGSFDAQLRTEQQRTAQERDTRRAEQAAGSAATEGQGADKNGDASGTAATETPDADQPGPGRRGGPAPPRDHSGDLKSEKASKKPDDNAGNGATAQEIPDGSDDDVVARRLRQAAERETDPELKTKLWQEYIDYKRNAQGK